MPKNKKNNKIIEVEKNSKYTVDSYKNKIQTFLKAHNKKFMQMNELSAKCRENRGDNKNYKDAMDELRKEGIIVIRKNGKIGLSNRLGYHIGQITRLNKTFGFGVSDENGDKIFFPGKFLLGAMPNDKILFQYIESRSGDPEGEVIDILEYGNSTLTGRITKVNGVDYFIPDTMSKNHIIISKNDNCRYNEGDKVLAEISYRGKRHSEHKVKIISAFGSSELAYSCAESILMIHGANIEFPQEVLKESGKIAIAGIHEFDFNNREDFRNLDIFTIDSAESKDLDDAVSVEKTKDGYLLGVHIADVSHYVKGNSPLDKEALTRGTSIYYANKVIPMLPKELSNGICSLNPNENRLTLSAIIELDNTGDIISYGFCKSVICSRVKGVYSEINDILKGTETPEIAEKYAHVREKITLINELADILLKRKKNRHAPELETTESKLIINENDVCVDVVARTRGKSECIIEEFMLMANEVAAKFATSKQLPFVYRIHEQPPEAKVIKLQELLPQFNISMPHFEEIKPAHMCEILENAKGSDIYEAINLMVLRSMSKAKYSHEPIGHFGLALKDYAHFTSPIRRYPDLAIHRIITDILAGYDKNWIIKRYSTFAVNAAKLSSDAEIKAVTIERECEDCYKAEYMKSKIGEVFEGKISSVVEFGFYVSLENTVEGLIHVRNLPMGEYDYIEPACLTEKFSGKQYKLGDKINVICTTVNVNDGNIDFVLKEDE